MKTLLKIVGFLIMAYILVEVCRAEESTVLHVDPAMIQPSPEEFSYLDFTNKKGETIGTLDWRYGEFRFQGAMDDAAKAFFQNHLKPIIDEYLKRQQCKENS